MEIIFNKIVLDFCINCKFYAHIKSLFCLGFEQISQFLTLNISIKSKIGFFFLKINK